jgi:hypothetical protein
MDVERFVDKLQSEEVKSEKTHEKEMDVLEKFFDLEPLGKKNHPCTLVDKHGRILIWHLPDILSKNRLVTI